MRIEEIAQDRHLAEVRAWLQERGITPPPPRQFSITTLPPPQRGKNATKLKDPRPQEGFEQPQVFCYCGQPAVLRNNAIKYGQQIGKTGYGWFCSRWPDCPGYCGTHPDGRPLGSLADPLTHRKRQDVHAVVDPLWREQGYSRGAVYGWLASISGTDHVHIGELSFDECDDLLTLIHRHSFVTKTHPGSRMRCGSGSGTKPTLGSGLSLGDSRR
jgi:hypothetical protein